MPFGYILLFVVLALGWCVILYRAAKKNGVEGFKGYFNAQTLGLPDNMRPFNMEHDDTEALPPKELVLTEDPEGTDSLPKGWVKLETRTEKD
jgi:hypothetical protein